MPKGWKVGFVHNCEQTNAFMGKKFTFARHRPMKCSGNALLEVWYGMV